MLGLRQQLASDQCGIGRSVGHDQQLAWTCRRIDRDGTRHLQLRLGDVGVPRPDDAIDARDALGAIGHGGDGACPTQREDATCASERRCGEHYIRRTATLACGRRAHHDLFDPGDARRHDPHQDTAGIRRPPTGGVHPDASERIGATSDDDAGLALGFLRARHEGAVHALDVRGRALHRATQLRLERRQCACPLAAWHFELVQRDAVELDGQRPQCGIAITSNAVHDAGSSLAYFTLRGRCPLEQSAPVIRRESGERSAPSQGDGRVEWDGPHAINRSMRVTRIPSAPSALRSAMVR